MSSRAMLHRAGIIALTIGIAVASVWLIQPAVAEPNSVRHLETGNLFDTLEDAIAATEASGYTTYTLEVLGDIAEPGVINLTSSNVTIVGDGSPHTVTGFRVTETGGSLTLGAGITPDNLTLSGAVAVKGGSIEIDAGVTLFNPNNSDPANPGSCNAGGWPTLDMDGAGVTGRITGGVIKGCTAIRVVNGVHITEISGGDFIGLGASAEVEHSTIDVISGGLFQRSSTTIERYSFTLDSGSHIGLISGGVFDEMDYSGGGALLVIRGSWIDEISGGQFLSPAAYDHPALAVFSDGVSPTGIGTISGGTFTGAPVAGVTPVPTPASSAVGLGVWVRGAGSRIDSITGGTFEGERAIEPDIGSVVGAITGGTFTSTSQGTRAGYGMLNAGTIGEIGGTAQFTGRNAGIWNYSNATISQISGGSIASSGAYVFGDGIANSGTITLISGGTIVGDDTAIYSAYGRVNTVTGGTFWGKRSEALYLGYPLTLEPGLTTAIGAGRYQAGNSDIFNNESLVAYPTDYFMSTTADTTSVTGVAAGFRYLMLPAADPPDEPVVDPPVVDPSPAVSHVSSTGGSAAGASGPGLAAVAALMLLSAAVFAIRRRLVEIGG